MNCWLKPIALKILDDPYYYLGELQISSLRNQEYNTFLPISIGFDIGRLDSLQCVLENEIKRVSNFAKNIYEVLHNVKSLLLP